MRAISLPAGPASEIELELAYEPDDAALREAIAILLSDDLVAKPGEAA